ncbi:MAG: hypothetical protein ACPLRM_02695, partial [Anaerolineae bacterium]
MARWLSLGRKQLRSILIVLLTAMLVIVALPWAGQSSDGGQALSEVEMEVLGQMGGAVRTVAVKGQYAYIGLGPRLAVLNIANRSNPQLVGQTGWLPDVVQAVAVSPTLSYVY